MFPAEKYPHLVLFILFLPPQPRDSVSALSLGLAKLTFCLDVMGRKDAGSLRRKRKREGIIENL